MAEYTPDGRLNAIRFLGFESSRKYTTILVTFNDLEKPEEIAYLDVAGKPALNENGIHKAVTKYDGRGNQIKQSYYDSAGELVPSLEGFKKRICRYYPNGQKAEQITYGFEPEFGYEKMVVGFDEKGNPIKSACFDANDQSVETEILVTEVVPDSRAEKMSIQVGDVFTLMMANRQRIICNLSLNVQPNPQMARPKNYLYGVTEKY